MYVDCFRPSLPRGASAGRSVRLAMPTPCARATRLAIFEFMSAAARKTRMTEGKRTECNELRCHKLRHSPAYETGQVQSMADRYVHKLRCGRLQV
jgi:hypothetical protein